MKPDERKKLLRDRGSRDIEAKCMQEVAERHRGAGEIRILKRHKGKKLWRGQRGETYISMKPNGCRKLKGTLREEKVRY